MKTRETWKTKCCFCFRWFWWRNRRV